MPSSTPMEVDQLTDSTISSARFTNEYCEIHSYPAAGAIAVHDLGICTRTCDIGSTIDKIGAAAAARGRRGRRGDGGGSDGAVMGVPANEPI